MKNSLMTMSDKILLRKRSIIETVNDELKNICQILSQDLLRTIFYTRNLLLNIKQ